MEKITNHGGECKNSISGLVTCCIATSADAITETQRAELTQWSIPALKSQYINDLVEKKIPRGNKHAAPYLLLNSVIGSRLIARKYSPKAQNHQPVDPVPKKAKKAGIIFFFFILMCRYSN